MDLPRDCWEEEAVSVLHLALEGEICFEEEADLGWTGLPHNQVILGYHQLLEEGESRSGQLEPPRDSGGEMAFWSGLSLPVLGPGDPGSALGLWEQSAETPGFHD